MTGVLYITDGTTYINLLTGIDGFRLETWTPTIPPPKQVWGESPLSDGRKLVLSKWANAIETFQLKVSRFTQDDVISDLQDLRRLLLQAREYFIGGSDVPVWIESKGECETNTRYAVICDWRAETDGDPYHKPFMLDHPVIDGFTLILERQHWRHIAPGQSECVELSATQDYYDEQIGSWVPGASADDCYINDAAGGSISLAGATLLIGDGGGANTYSTGIRFRNVIIPPSPDIIYAWIDVESAAADANDNCNVIIYGNDVDSAAIFSTYANFTGRVLTTAHTHWDAIPHWALGTHYQTPNIGQIIQEVTQRPGWASGNDIAILINNNASTANAVRRMVSIDAGAGGAHIAHLYVWWFDANTRTFGRSATCSNEVYVANKHNTAQLTHVFYDDGGVFSANLIGAARPFAFLPAVPAINDAVYFGSCTVLPDSGVFSSLVFDISTAQVDLTTITWQYWDGAAWQPLAPDLRDNTNDDGTGAGVPFDTIGVNSVHWKQPDDWAENAINGVTAYWVRALVGAVGAAPAPPSQNNRDIYTIITSFVDTVAGEVWGDIPALNKLLMEGQSGLATNIEGQTTIYAGLRSYNRGSAFTNFINISNSQHSPFITITSHGGVSGIVTDTFAAANSCLHWATAGLAAEDWLVDVGLGPNIVNHFWGRFRCFVRLMVNTATAANLLFRLKLAVVDGTNVVYMTDQKKPLTINPNMEVIDFGNITLPPMVYDSPDTYHSVIFRITGQALAAVEAHIYEVIVMPIDECFVKCRAISPPDSATADAVVVYSRLIYDTNEWRVLDVDSLIPRYMIRSQTEDITGYKLAPWSNNISGPLIWQPNEHQRWWFLQVDGAPQATAGPWNSLSMRGYQVSRYLALRGAR